MNLAAMMDLMPEQMQQHPPGGFPLDPGFAIQRHRFIQRGFAQPIANCNQPRIDRALRPLEIGEFRMRNCPIERRGPMPTPTR